MHTIYWLTGLPCSGKTTIAKELARQIHAEVLDGDEIREQIENVDFTYEGRARHMRTVGYLASRLSTHTPVVISLVSPLRSVRDELKKTYPNIREVFVKCSLEECKRRDVKGMYAKATAGTLDDFTGVHCEYEEPLTPDLTLDTEQASVKDCVEAIVAIHDRGPKALVIGRWQPFHDGHAWLVQRLLDRGHQVLIGIRNTPLGPGNPHTVEERIKMIRDVFGDTVELMVLPDIAGVYYGRNVGYEVEELEAPDHIAKISGTKIRGIKAKKNLSDLV